MTQNIARDATTSRSDGQDSAEAWLHCRLRPGDDVALMAAAERAVADDPELAARLFRRAAGVAKRAGRSTRAAAARQREVGAWGRAGRRPEALRAARAAAAAIACLEDRDEAMAYTSGVARGLLDAGATARALELLDDVVHAARQAANAGDAQHDGLLASALVNRALTAIDGRVAEEPDGLLDEAERLVERIGDDALRATVLINRAALASKRHDPATARSAYAEAAACYRRAGAADDDVAFAIRGEAATLAAVGRLREALERYDEATARFEQCGRTDEALITEIGAVMARHSLGVHVAEAERDQLEARLGDMSVAAAGSMAMNLANIAVDHGDVVGADRLRRRARRQFALAGARADVARVDLGTAVALRRAGDWEAALRRIARARRVLIEENRWLFVAHADHNAALVLQQRALQVEEPGGPLARRASDRALQALTSLDRFRHALPSAADRRALVAQTYPRTFSIALHCGLLAVRPAEVAAIVERARVQPVLAGRRPIRLATPAPVAANDGAAVVGGDGRLIVLTREAARLAGRGARWLGWWTDDSDVISADSTEGRVHVALRDLDRPAMDRLAASLAVIRPADLEAAGGDRERAERIALWRALRGPLLADRETADWVGAKLPQHMRDIVAAEEPVTAAATMDDAQLLWPISVMLLGPDLLEQLLRPARRRWRLVIAPPSAFGRVPWAALPLCDPGTEGDATVPRLIERADVVVGMPAALVQSRPGLVGEPPTADGIVVLVDPTEDLPWTRSIAVPGAVRLGPGARAPTRAALSSALADGARMLVLCGHVVPGSDDDPASSAFLLRGEHGKPDAFSVEEVAAVRAPPVCVLLGCDGAGASTGNEWTGVATGLVWAGAAWVVTTTWPVLEDSRTARVDADLVGRIRRDGPLEGLWGWQRSLAARWAADGRDHDAAPYRWAGTVVVGSGSRSAAVRMSDEHRARHRLAGECGRERSPCSPPPDLGSG